MATATEEGNIPARPRARRAYDELASQGEARWPLVRCSTRGPIAAAEDARCRLRLAWGRLRNTSVTRPIEGGVPRPPAPRTSSLARAQVVSAVTCRQMYCVARRAGVQVWWAVLASRRTAVVRWSIIDFGRDDCRSMRKPLWISPQQSRSTRSSWTRRTYRGPCVRGASLGYIDIYIYVYTYSASERFAAAQGLACSLRSRLPFRCMLEFSLVRVNRDLLNNYYQWSSFNKFPRTQTGYQLISFCTGYLFSLKAQRIKMNHLLYLLSHGALVLYTTL
jgi:hypothetical protein